MFWGIWAFPFWGFPFNASRHTQIPYTPSWALECWLWEDDVNNANRVQELLEGYKEHDFPVRTILIDSPWSTRYNDFTVDTNRYPQSFFKSLDEDGYRVVLWMTSMVNAFSKDTQIKRSHDWFYDAKSNGYLVGNGYIWDWWKGDGGFIDYTNPKALEWWQSLQQNVFDLGIDGWKLDGTATAFSSKLGKIPIPYQWTFSGLMTTRRYMDLYYRKEYKHGLKQNPDFITLSRSYDGFGHPEGFAPLDAAPVSWVGDQDHEWSLEKEGIEEAIRDIIRSGDRGYGVVGSDIGGYSGGEIPSELYIRWAEFSAFCGLFLNGGHGERRLWQRNQKELEIIRKFAWLHTELIPYIYSSLENQRNGGQSLIKSVPGKYQYMFGNDILCAPIHEYTNQRRIKLPKGKWRYLFGKHEVFQGPETIDMMIPLDEFPAFVREGGVIPMNICRDYSGFGNSLYCGKTTLVIYPALYSFREFIQPNSDQRYSVLLEYKDRMTVSIKGSFPEVILRVFMEDVPSKVFDGDTELVQNHSWEFLENENCLIIHPFSNQNPYITIQF